MRLASRPVAVRSTLPSELGTAEEGEGERSIVRLLFEYEWGGGRVAEDHVVDADVAPGTRGGIHDFEDRLASLKPAHVERLGPHAVGVPPGGGALHLAVHDEVHASLARLRPAADQEVDEVPLDPERPAGQLPGMSVSRGHILGRGGG